MGGLNKNSLSAEVAYAISISASAKAGLTAHSIYDMSPKNSFRGGSRGKGGKVKYPRR